MEPENLLKKNNIKITKGRIGILNILLNTEDAVTVDYIYEQCKERGLKIDLSTIYRTMDILENKNIIEKLNLGEDKFSYIIKKENHKHILECSLCHKEVEIDCPMLQIEEIIKNKTGFVLTEHDLKIKGICDECKNHSK
ncbi:Fe2+ or Zn2+ uptake regulation protein [Clostridium sp. USBA 49]|uniref:Fur family transcriptional regulator n=1 Tax=Clostridium sp. USBA 49 TaxID=1881060 RepID=UPI0009997D1C|nr:Fur family transcriptional regulator [Clostridium sp. USBA 49]SKA83907.1 Fe2+ or Zn2+ uptake regulation protein [Clostridium sp. USBA 49]